MKKKTGMKKRKIRNNYLLIVLLITIICSTKIYAQEEEREIAELYISTADSFYKNNNLSRAEVFLNKSLLYYKDSSDAYYLKSFIDEKQTGNTDQIINNLKKALILRNWKIYREEDAFFRLGMIYSSVKDYKKAVSTLYVIESEKIDNEEYLEAYSNSLLNNGMFVTASEILRTAIEKYPDNNRFKLKLINNDSDYYNSLILKILDKNDVYDFSPEIILEVLKNTEDEGIKKELYEKIKNYVKEFPEIIIEKIKIAKKTEESDIDNFFNYKGYENLKYLREFRKILLEKENINIFNKKISVLNSIIHDDINNDGLSEVIFRVENGRLVWYREDYNQDGLNDFYIYYSNGKIETIDYNENYLIKYLKYPVIENIVITSETIDIYDFSNRKTVFRAVDSADLFQLPEIKQDFKKTVDKLLKKASQHQKNNNEKNHRIIEYMKNSRIKMYSEIENGQTVSKGVIKDGQFSYINRNNNSENNFETKEIYRNGKLSAVLYDGNNDGLYEIKIENNTKYWDYNNDGIYDSYEKNDGNEIIKAYSSLNNGVFDIEEKSIRGIIVSVRKDEKWFNVSYDKNNNIYWIGNRIKNIKIETDKESYINFENHQIHIFKIADKFYAEVIN